MPGRRWAWTVAAGLAVAAVVGIRYDGGAARPPVTTAALRSGRSHCLSACPERPGLPGRAATRRPR